MYEYSKQEVKLFLESTSDRPQTLKVGLERRGFTILGTSGRGETYKFTVDKELVDPIVAEFGFKPTRPETTRTLLKAFHQNDGVLIMSWAAVSEYIKETQGINVAPNHLSTVYVELVNNEKACPVIQKIVLNEGKLLTEDEQAEFDEYLAELREWNDNMSITFQLALGKFNYQSVKVKEISAY